MNTIKSFRKNKQAQNKGKEEFILKSNTLSLKEKGINYEQQNNYLHSKKGFKEDDEDEDKDDDCELLDNELDEERITLGVINKNSTYLGKKRKYEDEEQDKVDSCELLDNKLDEERMTLDVIDDNCRSFRKKCRYEELKEKTNDNDYFNGIIIYDKKNKKLEKVFSGSSEDLNEFLNNCQMKKIPIEDISQNTTNSNILSFDPNEWIKSNNIYQTTLNSKDLSTICENKTQNNNNINTVNNTNSHNKNNKTEEEASKYNIKKEKYTEEEVSQYNIKKEKYTEFEPILKEQKIYDNYSELIKIISCKNLTKEQKKWINNFINEISNIDIKDIVVEENKEGKTQKLDIVFDLDNTIIFSFLSDDDHISIQNKKNIFPKKEVKMISFSYEDIVIYALLIIRNGFKEFIQYVDPLCTFHISTLGCENYGNEVRNILTEYSGVNFIRYKGRIGNNEYNKKIEDLFLSKEKTIIFDDNVNVWKDEDNEYVINSKFFYDEECGIINLKERNSQNQNFKYDKEDFKKKYKFYYNHIKLKDHKINDWKEQEIKECSNIPFYQFKQSKDYNYNQCYTAEYLNSNKLQFIYMKNVIKEIYYLKFVYGINIPLAIKLIRISTLSGMKFYLKYLDFSQKVILTDMVKDCGGSIYDGKHREEDEKIYLVTSKRTGYKFKKGEIDKEIADNPFYILINEKFILDTYYFLTNLKENINDPEYTFCESG